MNRVSFLAAFAFFCSHVGATLCDAEPLRIELETGQLFGTTVASSVSGYSGSGYVTGFDSSGDSVRVTTPIDAGLYDIWVGFRSQFGPKGYDLRIGDAVTSGMFPQSTNFAEDFAGQFYLKGGATEVEVIKNWGYHDVDYVEFRPAAPRTAQPVAPGLNHPEPSARTQFLMDYLAQSYGTTTHFAQQRHYSNPNEIVSNSYLAMTGGVFPAMIGSDLSDYSPSRVERGADANNESERMVQWAQQTGGIVTLTWHWNAPTDLIDGPNGSGQEWWRGFYTEATTFDLGAALANPSGQRYQLLLRDIDTIAVELTKYRDAGVPIIWRPLHEAQGNESGAWFWWGNSGAESFKQLYALMHDRLTNHHGLDNLIWASTLQVGEEGWMDWYPGDELVDIVGVDVYSNAGDNMSEQWLTLLDQFDGDKVLALTETGTLPPEEVIDRYGVAWSYAMPWSEEFLANNHTPAEVQAIVGSDEFVDLSELPVMPWRVAGAAPGDFDADGDVDADDYSVWREHFGLVADSSPTASPADANGDGRVDIADYTAWRDAMGAAVAAIPEPMTLAPTVIAAALLASRR